MQRHILCAVFLVMAANAYRFLVLPLRRENATLRQEQADFALQVYDTLLGKFHEDNNLMSATFEHSRAELENKLVADLDELGLTSRPLGVA